MVLEAFEKTAMAFEEKHTKKYVKKHAKKRAKKHADPDRANELARRRVTAEVQAASDKTGQAHVKAGR